MERLRELHGSLKIYLRAEAVNISTAELQMTKEFLESSTLEEGTREARVHFGCFIVEM